MEKPLVLDQPMGVQTLVAPLAYPYHGEDEREEVLRVLERAAADEGFIAALTDRGAEALEGYALSPEARAALLSGDLAWVESCVGRLDDRLRTWLECRLQQEIW